MQMSGHIHASAALPLGKKLLVGWVGPRVSLDVVVKWKDFYLRLEPNEFSFARSKFS